MHECIDLSFQIVSSNNCLMILDQRVNICPFQGSRTIRTEEAVLITLSRLSPYIAKNASSLDNSGKSAPKLEKKKVATEDVVFSDAAVSDESSEDEE